MRAVPVTLDRFILEGQQQHPGATGELSLLLMRLGVAGQRIARDLAVADIRRTHGSAGTGTMSNVTWVSGIVSV